jgi:hypothetical protein
MAGRDEAERLRQEVQRARRNATRKLSRLKTTHGVYGSGTRIDPRRKPQAEKRYTVPQLRKYLSELQSFTNRSTQYVADSGNRPVPAAEWRKYKAAERAYSEAVDKHFSQFASIPTPSGETIDEEIASRIPTHRRAGPVDIPYKIRERHPTNFRTLKKLREETKRLQKRTDPKHFQRLLRDARKQNRDLLNPLNDPELERAIKRLTPKQFELLWFYTPYAGSVSIPYEIYVQRAQGRAEERHHAKLISDSMSKAHEYVDWASKQ